MYRCTQIIVEAVAAYANFFSMRTTISPIILLLVLTCWPGLASAQKPFTCEDQFFLTLSENTPSLNEVIIDAQTGAATFKVINSNIMISVNAAGYRSVDNFIYCLDPQLRNLVRIDANGTAVVIANLPLSPNLSYFAGDITPDGRFLVLIGTAALSTGGGVAAQIAKVDLEDPNYTVTTLNTNTIAEIFDIAFHPVTDVLYGYDSYNQRLMTIDINAGSYNFPFASTNVPVVAGSLFFDAYGNLFAYGNPNPQQEQNTLYSLDPNTGRSTLITRGDDAISSDGCSCPYTVELSKKVEPKTTYPCTEVEYTFELVNSSRRPQAGLRLDDALPAGFTFVSVSSNPLGGTLVSQPGDFSFRLDNFTLPSGVFEIKIIVNTGDQPAGIYANQAILRNLPASLGTTRLSDDRSTLAPEDSTRLRIIRFPTDTLEADRVLCAGTASIRLDANQLANLPIGAAARFAWEDGSTLPYLDVSAAGEYQTKIVVGCDTAVAVFYVEFSSISVSVAQDSFRISLGDSIILSADAINSGAQTIYLWLDPEPGSVRCPACPETDAMPFNDITYTITAQNERGCADSAFVRVSVEKIRNIYFPNVFDPTAGNPDNHFFYGFSKQPANVKRFSIYSRWGELLFENRNIMLNDPNAGWDGTFRGRLCEPGVFAWVAQVAFLDGKEVTFFGDVTLLR